MKKFVSSLLSDARIRSVQNFWS